MEKEMQDYNIIESEKKWQLYWDKHSIYKFDNKKKDKLFAIDTPPPTVSGRMHIGHAFSYSQQDFIARFRRMNNEAVFYPFGTDDNGLPTERLVEKLAGVKSTSMKRAEFIELCLKTLKKITPEFIQDWKNLGISADYSISYSTIDKNCQRISQKSFIDSFKKGIVYRKEFPTIWCPECMTAIAQAELEDKQQDSLFSTIKFKIGEEDLLVATTRPELLPACVAIFVNPLDMNHKNLAGKKARVPLFDFEVPIISDKSADITKGTGVLMICSYGDRFDVEAIQKHRLEPKIVINKDGTLNSTQYAGMSIKDARRKILKELRQQNLVHEEKRITHSVNVHDRCGTEIEFLTTPQWFIKILDKKEPLIKQGQSINWHPEFMLKRYEAWIKGLEWDWSISRDRHFGVPIPVWECGKCGAFILPEEKELPVDPLQTEKRCTKCNLVAVPETKVLDTWATSSLTPQIASSLVSDKIEIPFSLRPQAHDIIRTWAFYTIVKSYLHENQIPWKDIMISGFVTLKGEKMSKSKGNVIQPQEVIEKYGADSLRFWAAGSKLGEDLDYQEKDILTGKKLITKLWNASKFVLLNLEDYKNEKPKTIEAMDKWILQKLSKLVKNCAGHFSNYEYSKVKAETENFFWHDFCDNYLEISKRRVYQGTPEEKLSAQYTLYTSLLSVIKLLAPIMPHITEEIYHLRFAADESCKSIHISSWPELSIKEDSALLAGDIFVDILQRIRQFKAANKKSLKALISLTLEKEKLSSIKNALDDFLVVVNAKEIKEGGFSVSLLE
ncbi:MAG: valine--tRNA ligase [archaeon]